MIPPTSIRFSGLAAALAFALAACADSANAPGRSQPEIVVDTPGRAVAVGALDDDGWAAVRGRVSQLAELDRLTCQVGQHPEREVEVRSGSDGEGTFEFAVTELVLGQHSVTLRAYARSGAVHVAPRIDVVVVPMVREIALPQQAANSFPTAINERGDVTGYWADVGAPTWHAFVRSGGQTRLLGEPGEWRSAALGLNDAGDVVGYITTNPQSPVERAMRWTETAAIPVLSQPGIASAINNDGVITGSIVVDANGPPRGFVVRGGQTTVLGDAGRITGGRDVNKAGHVVVSSHGQPGDVFSFVYANGETRQLPGLGGLQTAAQAINDAGVTVGYSAITDGSTYRAFRNDNGQTRALRNEALTDLASYGYDVNNRGIAVGEMVTTGDGDHWAFIATSDKLVALESLIPGSPALIGAYGINDRGEIAAVAISSTGWLRPVIVALPGGPEAVPSSVQTRIAPSRRTSSSKPFAREIERHRARIAP